MTEEINILNFDAALDALNTVSNSFKIDVYVPSLGKTVSFKEIDAKQQKSILSSAIDNSVVGSDFIKKFYEILKNNLLSEEDDILIDTFTIVDKAAIAFALRSQISSEYTVKFDDNTKEKINLNDVINNLKTFKTPDDEVVEIKNDQVTLNVTIGLPNIKDEVDFYEYFVKNNKVTNDIKSNDDVKVLISEAFIGEISRYIKSIKINDSISDFSTLTFSQRVRIVEKLPSNLIQKMLEKISNWKNTFESLITVKSEGKSKIIDIDGLLFIS